MRIELNRIGTEAMDLFVSRE